ncbi:unnamed protein product, partial [Linum tenue]
SFAVFRADLVASLAVPQGISYAHPCPHHRTLLELCAAVGVRDARELKGLDGGVAAYIDHVGEGSESHGESEAVLPFQLAITATFFAGVFEASLGFLRLGFIVDFLSHATIVGCMSGAATWRRESGILARLLLSLLPPHHQIL